MRMSKRRFEEEVTTLRADTGNYIDAMVKVCEKHSMEPETIARLVTDTLKEKIRVEAEALHQIKPERRRGSLESFA